MAKKIVVIDDEPDVVTCLTTLFEDNGFETKCAMDAIEGLKIMTEFNPDVITLDTIMPNKTGVGLYREMKKDENLKNIPVLVLSGVTQYQQLFSRDHLTLPKPEESIEKPFDKDELIKTIKKYIG